MILSEYEEGYLDAIVEVKVHFDGWGVILESELTEGINTLLDKTEVNGK